MIITILCVIKIQTFFIKCNYFKLIIKRNKLFYLVHQNSLFHKLLDCVIHLFYTIKVNINYNKINRLNNLL